MGWGEGDGSYGPVGAGAGAGGHLGRGPPIRSSPDGQDEAIDTPTMCLRPLVPKLPGEVVVMYI